MTQAADGKCRNKRNKTGKNCPDACKLFEGATVTKKDGEYYLPKDIILIQKIQLRHLHQLAQTMHKLLQFLV